MVLKYVTYKKIFFVLFLIFVLTMTGCSNSSGNEKKVEIINPDAEEVLKLDPEADIFQYNDVIYQTNIDWVEEKKLTKDEQVSEIKIRNETDTNFENDMSNKLPVGAKIFTSKEESDMFLLVEVGDEIIKYYAIVEG